MAASAHCCTRAVLALLACGIAIMACAAERSAKLKRIGILYQDPLLVLHVDAFEDKLRELGIAEGRTIEFERRMAGASELEAAAREMAESGVDVIVTPGTTAALAVHHATPQIPLIFYVADPLSSGLVETLARPGGNATGIASLAAETGTKRLELLREMLPRARRILVLSNPDNPITRVQQSALLDPARRLIFSLHNLEVRTAQEVERALPRIDRRQFDAFIILPDAVLIARNIEIAQHALKGRVPGVFSYRMFPEAGGLASYGPNFTAVWQRCAIYADKILKGARPGDLPVEQPSKFELVINLRTAKRLGINVPESILVRADEVIR
jgi:putative tryptophan/tyrosine transport system substrate-binding protein